jgi:lipoprotein-releasing system permease protein
VYKLFMARRYLYTRLIAIFAILGVTLCVAMVLVVMSVMGGFLDSIRDRSRGLLSDLILDGGSLQGWPYYDEFGAYLDRELPDVVRAWTPVIRNYGLIREPSTSWTKPTQVVGIKLDEYKQINDFARGLHYQRYWPGSTRLGEQRQPLAAMDSSGRWSLPADLEAANKVWRDSESDPRIIEEFDELPYVLGGFGGPRVYDLAEWQATYSGDPLFGVIPGCDLVNQREDDGSFTRQFPRGLEFAVIVVPLTIRGNISGEPPASLRLRYADDVRTGVYEVDSMSVYVDFDMLQHQLAMDPQELQEGGMTRARTVQLFIGLEDGVELNAGKKQVADAWQRFLVSIASQITDDEEKNLRHVTVDTWEDLQRAFIQAVEKEKVLVTFLFGLISVVAIVLIGCIFYMIVQKKTRDIGILKAVGASGSGIAVMFIIYAASVGVIGAVLGTAIGSTFVWYINEIQEVLISIHPTLRVWDPSVYTFDRIPNVVKAPDVIWIGGVAILASMLGSVIPATIAGRVWPAQAVRYE